jgi:hypothetical protein
MSQYPDPNYNPGSGDPYNQRPQDPYNTPPQNPSPPYGSPPQTPYGTPPPQDPYSAPPQTPYGAPPSQYPQSQYGGYIPPVAPLPVGEAIKQLPNQYIKVLTKPSAQTFAEEIGKASWGIVWVQLVGYAIITALLTYPLLLISSNNNPSLSGSNTAATAAMMSSIVLPVAIAMLVIVPIGFFLSNGIYYLLAKMFSGTGTFLQQSYATTLYTIPVGLISLVVGLIPFLGSLASFALGIYSVVLAIFAMMAVHRLSGGKATAVVLIPVAILLVLACIAVFVVIGLIAAAVQEYR